MVGDTIAGGRLDETDLGKGLAACVKSLPSIDALPDREPLLLPPESLRLASIAMPLVGRPPLLQLLPLSSALEREVSPLRAIRKDRFCGAPAAGFETDAATSCRPSFRRDFWMPSSGGNGSNLAAISAASVDPIPLSLEGDGSGV